MQFFFFYSRKVEVEGISEVWVQRKGNGSQWRITFEDHSVIVFPLGNAFT